MLGTNLSSHIDKDQRDSYKPPELSSADCRDHSTSSGYHLHSNDDYALNSHSQSGFMSPSNFLNLASKESFPFRNSDEDYQVNSVAFDENSELFCNSAVLYPLEDGVEEDAEEARPNPINTDTIFDPLHEDYNNLPDPVPELQAAQENSEEMNEKIIENLQDLPIQPKKKVFTIIRLEIKKSSSYKLKNAPFLVFNAIKNGVRNYNPGKNSYFQSISYKLDKMSQSQFQDFKNLMSGFKDPGRTFISFGRYFKQNYGPEVIALFIDVLIAFLGNAEDVEKWLKDSPMKSKTKQNIRQTLYQLESDFVKALLE